MIEHGTFRFQRRVRSLGRGSLLVLAEIALIVAIGWVAVSLFWTLVRPLGPVGDWRAPDTAVVADPALLTRFDPFFREGTASRLLTVTALPLKLFGTRLDQAIGRGSAIIAAPDGRQSSYGVGDEIVPGVRLRAVAFDHVTIDRGGVAEQLFLDQSVAAPAIGAALAVPTPLRPGQPPVTAVPPMPPVGP